MGFTYDTSTINIPMPNVTPPKNIYKCENCVKEDVCKYKEQFKKINNLADNWLKNNSESRDEYESLVEIVEISIKCRKFNCNNYNEVSIRG